MSQLKKCIVIPDSFKGTLSSIKICNIMSKKIMEQFPECQVSAVTVADGGEGTVDAFLYLSEDIKKVVVDTTNSYGEPCTAYYALNNDVAIIEMASVAGLPQVEGRLNPVKTTTFGLGELIKDAIAKDCKQIIIGLGGSCTNDGGTGVARALGTKFYDENGVEFAPLSNEFHRIFKIDNSATEELLKNIKITAMCDINNPMYGENGAAYIFAPQKGAAEEMVKDLDLNLQHLDKAIQVSLNKSVSQIEGAGAAGALGAGVLAFLNGELKPGIDTVLDYAGFDEMLDGTDMVFTGEGKIDSQSLNGKVVIGVGNRAKQKNVPVVVVAGDADGDMRPAYKLGVSAIFSTNRIAQDFSISRYNSAENLAATMEDIVRLIKAV